MASIAAQSPPSSLLRRHRQLAPNCSLRVSPLCLGTMSFGTPYAQQFGSVTKDAAFEMLDAFYAAGGNFVDTACGYQAGESERWLGEWMEDRGLRDEMVIATKYTHSWRLGNIYNSSSSTSSSSSGVLGGDKSQQTLHSNFAGNGTKSMRLAVESSLKKLRTNYIDILYVHWWDYTTTIPELMHALNDLVVRGQVLHLGISDAPAWVAASANQYARCHGLRPFIVYQGQWNAAMRDLERDVIPMCRAEGMGIAPYGVLGQGRFQTKDRFTERDELAKSGARHDGRHINATSMRDRRVSAVLEHVATQRSQMDQVEKMATTTTAAKTTLWHVALAYCVQKTPYVFPLVGVRTLAHVHDAIAGLRTATLGLSDDDMRRIDGAYPFDHGFPHTFLSGSVFEVVPDDANEAGETNRGHRPAWAPGHVALASTAGTFDWVEGPRPIRLSKEIVDGCV